MKYEFQIGDKVIHKEEHVTGTIVELTSLKEVTEGNCKKDYPWYVIEWDEEDFTGQESEDSLLKI